MSKQSAFRTEQEQFWAGEFGTEYAKRNLGSLWVASNAALFSDILRRTRNVRSVLELGANIGLNLAAIRSLLPSAALTGLEINPSAVEQLAQLPGVIAVAGTLLDPPATLPVSDLLLIKGVLIHIAPEKLEDVYDHAYRLSSRYVCLVEYYNPTPVALPYRGVQDRLFKRDFAGEMLDRFEGKLTLVDYGFVYRRDPNFPQDDVNWFLLEKVGPL